jgi:hypothetical protein
MHAIRPVARGSHRAVCCICRIQPSRSTPTDAAWRGRSESGPVRPARRSRRRKRRRGRRQPRRHASCGPCQTWCPCAGWWRGQSGWRRPCRKTRSVSMACREHTAADRAPPAAEACHILTREGRSAPSTRKHVERERHLRLAWTGSGLAPMKAEACGNRNRTSQCDPRPRIFVGRCELRGADTGRSRGIATPRGGVAASSARGARSHALRAPAHPGGAGDDRDRSRLCDHGVEWLLSRGVAGFMLSGAQRGLPSDRCEQSLP